MMKTTITVNGHQANVLPQAFWGEGLAQGTHQIVWCFWATAPLINVLAEMKVAVIGNELAVLSFNIQSMGQSYSTETDPEWKAIKSRNPDSVLRQTASVLVSHWTTITRNSLSKCDLTLPDWSTIPAEHKTFEESVFLTLRDTLVRCHVLGLR